MDVLIQQILMKRLLGPRRGGRVLGDVSADEELTVQGERAEDADE